VPEHPLVELSTCPHPDQVQGEKARAAVVGVTLALRQLLKGVWPRPFQLIAIAYAELTGDRCLIADDMGLGKTPISICRLVLRPRFPAVIVVPASVLLNWREEIMGNPDTGKAGWFPGVPVHVVDKVRKPIPPWGWRGIVLTTWTLLTEHALGIRALRPQILIADEAHYIANPEAKRSEALQALIHTIPHLLLVTGTPINNKSEELWVLLNLLNPKAWPDEDVFKEMSKSDMDNRGIPTMLQRKIRQYMIRRLKADVLTELPPKTYSDVAVPMHPVLRAQYDYVEKHFESWLYKTTEIRMARALGTAVRTPELIEKVAKSVEASMKGEHMVRMGVLRRLVGLAKVPAAIEWIARTVTVGEPVVVFADHKEVLAALMMGLQQRGIQYTSIIGKTSKVARQKAKADFQAGLVPVFLASKAAKEGITLTRARHVLFVERWWTPGAEDQAADRLHRISQKRKVQVWVMRAINTIDTRMNEINLRKRKIVERVVGGTPLALSADTP
jgi:SWI/SNF-related matrix-associated actin-dependent regulator of chromatin subfamily A-like protein 1